MTSATEGDREIWGVEGSPSPEALIQAWGPSLTHLLHGPANCWGISSTGCYKERNPDEVFTSSGLRSQITNFRSEASLSLGHGNSERPWARVAFSVAVVACHGVGARCDDRGGDGDDPAAVDHDNAGAC